MKKQPSIALLVRCARRWPEVLQTCRVLLGSGSTVSIFFLGNDSDSGEIQLEKLRKFLKHLKIDCFADQPVIGMVYLPLERMAQRLKHYNLVIPI